MLWLPPVCLHFACKRTERMAESEWERDCKRRSTVETNSKIFALSNDPIHVRTAGDYRARMSNRKFSFSFLPSSAPSKPCATLKYENFFQEHAVRARGKLRNGILYTFSGVWYGINKKTTFHPAHSLYFEFRRDFRYFDSDLYMAHTHTQCTALTMATATMNNYFNMRKRNNRHPLLLTTMPYVWWVAHISPSTLHLGCVCEPARMEQHLGALLFDHMQEPTTGNTTFVISSRSTCSAWNTSWVQQKHKLVFSSSLARKRKELNKCRHKRDRKQHKYRKIVKWYHQMKSYL